LADTAQDKNLAGRAVEDDLDRNPGIAARHNHRGGGLAFAREFGKKSSMLRPISLLEPGMAFQEPVHRTISFCCLKNRAKRKSL
jgi:hypothetical protein